MNKDLYFIPLLSSAAERRDSKEAFAEAFSQIRAMGATPDYRRGYEQFNRWLEEVATHTHAHPVSWLEFRIERQGEPDRAVRIDPVPGTVSVSDVKPGGHRIRFQTGMLLWEGEFRREQLLWAYAFADENLPVAAADLETAAQVTSETVLFDGELILRTYPGPQAGRLEIEVCRGESDE